MNTSSDIKLLALETDRLDAAYQSLEHHFAQLRQGLADVRTKLEGKLSELDFNSRYLGAILNHISQGILFIDVNGIVTTYNATAQQMLGFEEHRLLYAQAAAHLDDRLFGFSLKQALTTKVAPQPHAVTLSLPGRSSLELEVEAIFVSHTEENCPVSLQLGHRTPIQGLLLILRDVTLVNKLQQRANRNDRLKEVGELAAHIAHEIRNPLGGIAGFAALLKHELADRPDLQKMAQQIASGTEDLNAFVTQILDYTRPPQPKFELLPLKPCLDEVKRLLMADSRWQADLAFHVEAEPELRATFDPHLMKSALLNLCLNSIQAMPTGGVLSLSLAKQDHAAVVTVKDTGKGIPEENLSKLFTPFFTTKEKGSGLGLAEVLKVIQAHHGTVDVASEAGKGTCFTIKIPL